MPVFFKMTCKGLDSINGGSLAEPAQVLLLKILYHHGQNPLTMEQLLDYLGTDRKTATRILYKMLHSGWLINIEENLVAAMINKESSKDKQARALPSLGNVVDDNQLVLSEQHGLVISTLGFSSEQSVILAATAAELLKKHDQKISDFDHKGFDHEDSDHNKTVFPVFFNFNWRDLTVESRLIQVHGLCFIITSKSTSTLNNELYFDLISNLLRRYGSE